MNDQRLQQRIKELCYSIGVLLAAAGAKQKPCPFCSLEIREVRAQRKLVFFELNGRLHPCTPGLGAAMEGRSLNA